VSKVIVNNKVISSAIVALVATCISAKNGLYDITAVSLELSHLNKVRAGLNFRFGGG
jgi:hypothetical protein